MNRRKFLKNSGSLISDVSEGPAPGGIEALTRYEQFCRFIDQLDRRFSEDEISLALGGNYLRIWKEILPD